MRTTPTAAEIPFGLAPLDLSILKEALASYLTNKRGRDNHFNAETERLKACRSIGCPLTIPDSGDCPEEEMSFPQDSMMDSKHGSNLSTNGEPRARV